MRDIILKQTSNDALEAVLPVDRVITIDGNNVVYLSDTAFIIDENMIEGGIIMAVINNNKYMLDRPMWEQLSFAPATGIAGSCNCDDNRRFIYNYFQTSTTSAQFWRYDTWADCWQQLASPATQTGSVGGGCTIKWLPSFAPDKLYVIRGNGTSNIYAYDLVANTWSTASFHPSTETFTTASTHTARSIGNKGYSIISSKEATMRIYEYDPSLSRLHPKMNQWLYPTGAAVQGDRATCLRSPDEVEFYYLLLPSSTALVRCALIDS